jgi:hypothetical protein
MLAFVMPTRLRLTRPGGGRDYGFFDEKFGAAP